MKNVIDSVIEKDRERYEQECAQAASELVRKAIERIVSGESERDCCSEDVVEMLDALGGENEKEATALAKVIERMQIDKNDIEHPSFLLCRSVPKNRFLLV